MSYGGMAVTTGTVITAAWGQEARNRMVFSFADATARDAAITSPETGQLAYLEDSDRLTHYDGAVWEYVDHAGTSLTTATTGATSGTTTSTSYTDNLTGPGTVAASITVPQSGKVLCHIAAELDNSSTELTYLSVRLSGSDTVAAADTWCIRNYNGDAVRCGSTHLFTGLTAGGTLTATLQHRVTGGTGTFDDRELILQPVQ